MDPSGLAMPSAPDARTSERRSHLAGRSGARLAVSAAFTAALVLTACGSSDRGTAPAGTASTAAAQPIAGLQPGVWTWVDVPESACDDGSATGMGVSLGTGPDLVVFLNGGGACWDYLTCYVLSTASRGPFGRPQFEALQASALPGSFLDRDLAGNPFHDASMVFVPYCTGDIHGGDNVATYVGLEGPRVYHHVGHANLVAFLARVAATWPSPRKLVVSGSSAGGFGALINYDTFRSYWPASRGYLIDDSGPPLEKGAVSQALLDAWYATWRLDEILDPVCGQACRTDLSAGLAAVERKYPQDRVALLSSLQDQVIAGYYQIDGAQLESALDALATNVIAPAPSARFFFVSGNSHTMLGNPASFAQGVSLLGWLQQQLSDDVAWTSQRP